MTPGEAPPPEVKAARAAEAKAREEREKDTSNTRRSMTERGGRCSTGR